VVFFFVGLAGVLGFASIVGRRAAPAAWAKLAGAPPRSRIAEPQTNIPPVIVVGGVATSAFSMVPVKRSAQRLRPGRHQRLQRRRPPAGLQRVHHFDETIYGGDFLADQPPVYEMAHWAPKIIDLLDRMGVPFNRTPEGQRDLRLFGGSALQAHPLRRRHDGPATHLRPR
jgi:hypothetical protein